MNETLDKHIIKYLYGLRIINITEEIENGSITIEAEPRNSFLVGKTDYKLVVNNTYERLLYGGTCNSILIKILLRVTQYKCCYQGKYTYLNNADGLDYVRGNNIATKWFVKYLTYLKKEGYSLRDSAKLFLDKHNTIINHATLSKFFKYFELEDKAKVIENKIEIPSIIPEGLVILNQEEIKERFMNGNCDAIFPLIVNYADHILNIIEKDYNLIEIFNSCFKDSVKHIDAIAPATYIMSSISARFRSIWASSKMNVVITSPELLLKLKSTLYLTDNNQTIYAVNSLREFVLRYRVCEADPVDKVSKKKILKTEHKKVHLLINSFNKFFSKLDNHTDSLNMTHKNKKIYIIDSTIIEVTDPKKYECAGTTKRVKNNKDKYTSGYKLLTIGKVLESGFLITHADIASIEKFDSKFASEIFEDKSLIEKDSLYILDRGFLDINLIKEIKNNKADVIIPVKKNMDILKEAIYLSKDSVWENISGEDSEFTYLSHLIMYDKPEEINKGNINITFSGSLIRTKLEDKEFFTGREDDNNEYSWELDGYRYNLIITTDDTLTGNEILSLYKIRWTVETAYKENKSNLGLNNFKSTLYELIVYHLLITLCAYNVGEIFRDYKQYGNLTNRSIALFVKDKNNLLNNELNTHYFIKSDNMFGVITKKETFKMVRTMSDKSYNMLMDKDELWD